nr:unnamed protein product [Callosobruchus analis]
MLMKLYLVISLLLPKRLLRNEG